MLGFGYNKNTVKDGLKRSTRAVLIGGLFHHEHASSFGLNEEGSAWLYTEMQAQLIFCIGIAFEVKICGKKSWATPQFMQDCIKEEILEAISGFPKTKKDVNSIRYWGCPWLVMCKFGRKPEHGHQAVTGLRLKRNGYCWSCYRSACIVG